MGEIKVAEWANIKPNGRKSAPNGRMIRRMGEAIRLNGRKYLKKTRLAKWAARLKKIQP